MSEVDITLKGRPEILRCTLKAAKSVNGIAGGFQGALARLATMDQDAYFLIVAAGLGKRPVDVEHAVYETGLTTLTEALSNYVLLLANGGKPLAAAEDAGEGEA